MASDKEEIKVGPFSVPLPETPYDSPHTSLGINLCINMYYEQAKSTTSTFGYYYTSIPPLKIFGASKQAKATNKSPCRGLYTSGSGRAFGAWNNGVYEIIADGTRVLMGELLSFTGNVRFADNTTEMCVVDGKAGYILDLATGAWSRITDSYFPGIDDNDDTSAPTHVTCIDEYFIVNRNNSNKYYWSNRKYVDQEFGGETHKWVGLSFGIKAGYSDEIVAMVQAVSYLWIFGRETTEVHYDSGDYQNQLFRRLEGAFIKMGTSAPNSVVSIYNNVFWIGSDQYGSVGIYGADSGFAPVKISTLFVDTTMAAMDTFEDAQAYVHSHSGHTFITWYFPTARQTWVYDMTTQKWHQRCYKDYVSGTDNSPWMGLFAVEAFGKVLVGDRASNAIYTLQPNAGFNRSIPRCNDDADGVGINDLQCTVTTANQMNQGKLTRYKSFYLICQMGKGLTNDILAPGGTTAYGSQPKAMISWSDNGGETWSNEHQVDLGAVGVFNRRPRMVKLGMGRLRVWKIRISDPVAVVVDGVLIDYQIMGR